MGNSDNFRRFIMGGPFLAKDHRGGGLGMRRILGVVFLYYTRNNALTAPRAVHK